MYVPVDNTCISIIAVDPEVKDENTCMSSSLGQVSKPKFFSIYYSKNIINVYYICSI